MNNNYGTPNGDDPSREPETETEHQHASPWYEENQPGASRHGSASDEVVMTIKPMDRIRVGIDYQYQVSIISMERDDEPLPCVVTLNSRGLTAFIWHLRTVLQEMERSHRPPPVSFY